MKKIMALLLAILMATFLFSCSSNNTTDETGESDAAASTAVSEEPSSDTSEAESADTNSDTVTESTVGYLTDDVDYFARDAYHVTYLYAISVPLTAKTGEKLEVLAEKMNFTLTQMDANNDLGKFVDCIEQEIGTGTDGFIFSSQADVLQREDELCKEAGLPYVSLMTPYLDEEGNNQCPTVQFDGEEAGGMLADWVVENYSNYFDDVELESIGFMVMGFSVDQTFVNRSDGFMNELKAIRPELESNIIYVDCIDGGFSTESGYNKAAATISANADIENWVIFAVSEEFNLGACRAVETAGKEDDCIVVSTGCDAVFLEWDDGNSPEWVATIPVYCTDLAVGCATGIIALIDGRATSETLWEELKRPNDICAMYNLELQVVTPDTYNDFIANSEAALDLLD